MTAVIITGGIDLSVGAVLALSGMVIGMSMNVGAPFWVAVPLALGAALLVGGFNGVMIAHVGMPPFVVTLGMLSIARSLAMVLSNNRMVYEFGPDQAQLLALGGGFISVAVPFRDAIRVPNPVVFLVVMALATGWAFRWTKWGRHVFAIGGNEAAANLTGVPVRRVKVSVYMLCSACAGIAGILEVGWLGTISTSLGQGMELDRHRRGGDRRGESDGRRGYRVRRGRRGRADRDHPQQPHPARHQHVLAGHLRRQLHHRRGAVRSVADRTLRRLTCGGPLRTSRRARVPARRARGGRQSGARYRSLVPGWSRGRRRVWAAGGGPIRLARQD